MCFPKCIYNEHNGGLIVQKKFVFKMLTFLIVIIDINKERNFFQWQNKIPDKFHGNVFEIPYVNLSVFSVAKNELYRI